MRFSALLTAIVFCLTGFAYAQTAEQEIGVKLAGLFKQAGSTLRPPKPKPKSPPAIETQGAPKGGRELSVLASAYCLTGQTASGRYTRHGIIAVDPRVIPMGSKMYVPGYGWGIAADTGGMIKGNVIDIWLPTSRQCYDWGVRRVRIKVFPRR